MICNLKNVTLNDHVYNVFCLSVLSKRTWTKWIIFSRFIQTIKWTYLQFWLDQVNHRTILQTRSTTQTIMAYTDLIRSSLIELEPFETSSHPQHHLSLQYNRTRKHKAAGITLKAAVPQKKEKNPGKQLQGLRSNSSIKQEMFNRLCAAVISFRPRVPEQRYHDLCSHTETPGKQPPDPEGNHHRAEWHREEEEESCISSSLSSFCYSEAAWKREWERAPTARRWEKS